MKPANIGAMVLLVLLSACKPQVGPPISLINGPAILAVKGEPAEVDPRPADATVHYEALAVDSSGRVPAPTADISSPLLWSICNQPKPPTQSNSVSTACLDQNALPGVAGDSLDTYSALAPSDSCTLFGPLTPPPPSGQPPIRPRDPDVTGGYYLPVRLSLSVPEGLRRAGMATEDSIVAFQLQRIYCGLANAPGLGHPPVRNQLQAQPEPGDRLADPAAARFRSSRGASGLGRGRAVPGCGGQTVSLAVNWPADSVENYPAWDVLSKRLSITTKPCGFPGTQPQGPLNTTSLGEANLRLKLSPIILGRQALRARFTCGSCCTTVAAVQISPATTSTLRPDFADRVDGDLLHLAE